MMKHFLMLATLGLHAAIAGTAFAAAPPADQLKPLQIQVFNTSLGSLAANVTLIKGDKGAVLVDAPFTQADAHRVIAEILDSGRSLDAILITHDHPDHYFGLDVITATFPQARVLANAVVARDVARSLPIKFARWAPGMGANAPRYAVFPAALGADNVFLLEGHLIEVRGPIQGDHVHCTYVWIPESRTLIAGDLLFNDMFLWLGEHREAQYAGWLKSLDELEALHPATVVAGHRKPGLADDAGSIAFTRKYIQDFRALAGRSKTSAQLGAALHAAYPEAIDVANGFLVGVSSQVATGEIAPWDE
jgi:glyoxylase-like metal-dependent hydrolase (beta-lactamase superfamily II)